VFVPSSNGTIRRSSSLLSQFISGKAIQVPSIALQTSVGIARSPVIYHKCGKRGIEVVCSGKIVAEQLKFRLSSTMGLSNTNMASNNECQKDLIFLEVEYEAMGICYYIIWRVLGLEAWPTFAKQFGPMSSCIRDSRSPAMSMSSARGALVLPVL
jgi:hypothetical protein